MRRFCEEYKITKYKKYISIQDVIGNVLDSKNKSYYINKINNNDFKIFENEKYVSKNTLVEFFNNCKNKEARTACNIITSKKKIDSLSVMIYDNIPITINTVNNELWIKAKDITYLLGFNNTKETISKYVDNDDMCKQYNLDNTAPRKNSPLYINESGFYALILNSNHTHAKRIKKWITKEVLPAIRKTGTYNHIEEIKKIKADNQILQNKNNTYLEEIKQLQTEKMILEEKLKKPQRTKSKQPIPKAVRLKVWTTYIGMNQASGRCFCCQHKVIDQQDFQCGHIESESMGGDVSVQNLRPICGTCNGSMGTKNMFTFMKKYGFDTKHI